MPRPGGEADKLGNRYEGLWVVDAALDLIDGEFSELVFEAIGDEAAGVEFYRTKDSGVREYHSIKRQQADGNWTISRLTQADSNTSRSILGDIIGKIREGADGVFSSGTSATELEELIERARSSDLKEEFQRRIGGNGQLSGRFLEKIVPICDDEETAYSVLRRIQVRTKNEPELTKDVERRIRSTFRMSNGEPTDPRSVRLLTADFATQRMGAKLVAESFLSYLSDHGIVPSRLMGDTAVDQRMRQLNRAYLSEVDRLLINRTEIDRSESRAAYAVLVDGGKSVILEAGAGGGKSCVLAQAVRQLDDNDVPSLVIRMDRFTDEDYSSQVVGTRRGLQESPTITLGEFAGDRPSVLCIDQLDALSIVSARQQSAWGAFNELLDEARDYPNMRVLFACRSFDLEKDPQLRALGEGENVERIPIGDLDSDSIQEAIAASGVDAGPLSVGQMRLVSVPLHLHLFLEAARIDAVEFASRRDLFDAYWNSKARSVDRRLVSQAQMWTQATASLCEVMSDRESLVALDYALDDFREAIDVMASEGVVYIEGGEVRFFHEAFFDYSFARTFLRNNNDLVQWLVSDEQHLFRRSQVRQVLTFLREREPDRSRYLRTLRRLLENANVRFHIKKLVLEWLGSLSDPTMDEWNVVEGLVDELDGHAWQVVSNSVPWFDLLQEAGRWISWLAADEEQVDMTIRLLGMPDVLNARSAAVTSIVAPFRGQSEQWRIRLRWLVQRGYGYTSTEMEYLVIALIVDGTLDDASPEAAVNDDWWSIWYGSSTAQPAFTSRVVGAWLDRQFVRAGEKGSTDPLGGDFELVAYSQSSGEVIRNCSSNAPREFVQEILPRLLTLETKAPLEYIEAPSELGEPVTQLRNALAEAMISLSGDDPVVLDSIMSTLNLSDTKWVSSIVLRAWSANPDFYAERIVQFLLANPDQRLVIGYDISVGEVDAFAAVSRTAVAAASSVCSDQSFSALENAILTLSPDWEKESRLVGRTELALLRSLAKERVAETTRQRIRELQRRFPTAPESGIPEIPEQRPTAQWLGSPLPSEALLRMSDDQWLSAMAKYTSEWTNSREGDMVGGSVQLSRGLESEVRKSPGRFTALVDRMDGTHQPVYFAAILRGLAAGVKGAERPGTVDQISSVIRRIESLGVPVDGAEVSRAVRALANETIPDDILLMVCRIAVEDPDPDADVWIGSDRMAPINQAINSARGAAADALAELLLADTSRWDSLKPTVEQVVGDRVLAVRSVAVNALFAILDAQRNDALAYFDKLVVGADPILKSEFVRRFINFAMFRDYARMRPILLRMLESADPGTVRAGARHLVTAALWMDEARGDDVIVLGMSEEARAGAAEVYGEYLSNETVGTECEKLLVKLFADESEIVRKAASNCWRRLKPDQIASRGSLIGEFVRSMGPGDSASILAYRLNETRRPLPAEVCDLAERAVATYGYKAAYIQFSEAGTATYLSALMVRLLDETDDPILRNRILNAIDEMIRAGFMGIGEQLGQQYDR